ncbi:MAG: hypothetical protein NFCOHLIN_01923 [Gammaproteobacteria bacterium]|nr:hypothetical protein [Gammaproteobacteria bacterium]
MTSVFERHRADLQTLSDSGTLMLSDLHLRLLAQDGKLSDPSSEKVARRIRGTFERRYQAWFSEAAALIRQLLPERHAEFVELYHSDNGSGVTTVANYCIRDWLRGVRISTRRDARQDGDLHDLATVSNRFTLQLAILRAASRRFESGLFDIWRSVQSDVLSSELQTARSLAERGFPRAAGAVAGVVLVKHLGELAQSHDVDVPEACAEIETLGDVLKKENVIDMRAWQDVRRLGDIRRLCDHVRERDPTAAEVEELISGVERITRTVR